MSAISFTNIDGVEFGLGDRIRPKKGTKPLRGNWTILAFLPKRQAKVENNQGHEEIARLDYFRLVSRHVSEDYNHFEEEKSWEILTKNTG